MIRILHTGMVNCVGGIECYLINYYRDLDKEQVQFDFINIHSEKLAFQDEIEKLGGKVYKVSNYYKHPFKYIKEVSRIIKENNYLIVHCNMNSAVMLFPLIAAKIGGAKVIIAHAHNSASDKGLLKSILHNINKHFIPLFANNYFACSMKAGKWFFSRKIINSDKFKIIENGIDVERYKFNNDLRKEKRHELGINDNTTVIGHVGRFEVQKNHTFLIDVFMEYHKINKNSVLVLIGDGTTRSSIKKKVLDLNLEDSVLFIGYVGNAYEYYQIFDLFLLPSLYEGLPLVAIEAQASGLPCIFSDTITKELDVLNLSLFISLKEDSKIWALKIDDYLQNKTGEKFRLSNYEKSLKSRYNIKIASSKLLEIYLSMINKC